MTSNLEKTAVIEKKPDGDREGLLDPKLAFRLRQQEILAELGVIALQGVSFAELLDQTARLTAEGLRAEFCKILEYQPAANCFLVTAGVGWGDDVIGVATVGADQESPAGFALLTGKPVISNHLENEQRFRTPLLLVRYGIHRAMNVILQGDGSPYGVLEVDSRSEGEFSAEDIAFLQGAANILGMAIERQRIERNLRTALERNELLLKEVNHRVNNSLALVASALHLQSSNVDDEVRSHLEKASNRISAIARAHRHLYQTGRFDEIEMGPHLQDMCQSLSESLPKCDIHVSVDPGITIPPDQAVTIALFVNELVTNSAKYAYPDSGGDIWVTARAHDGKISISVRDKGIGLPGHFDCNAQSGLGMRMITAFAKQLGGELEIRKHEPGVEFVLTFVAGAAGQQDSKAAIS